MRFFFAALILMAAAVNADSWFEQLPVAAQDSVVWLGDHEEGALDDWDYPEFEHAGGGVLTTGGDDVWGIASQDVAHSGDWSAEATITNATPGDSRAVRLMRWTDRPYDDGGQEFGDEMYFSTWMYFPRVYDPEWWNVFQFKSQDKSRPVAVLNVANIEGVMSFYVYSKSNPPHGFSQADPLRIPVMQWIHVEAFLRSHPTDGQLIYWQDGVEILRLDHASTSHELDFPPTWGIGNYTDQIAGDPRGDGTATIYFDDAAVSRLPLSFSTTADFDSDGDVDGSDLLRWQRLGRLGDWQSDFGAASNLVTVGEPTATCLAVGCLLYNFRERIHRNA